MMGIDFDYKGNYIAGQFTGSRTFGNEFVSLNPGKPTELVGRFIESETDVKRAAETAQESSPKWVSMGPKKRRQTILQYKALLQRNKDRLSHLISLETGKPLWEARAEVTSMLSKIDITINESLRLVDDFSVTIGKDVVGWARFKPIGVLAVLGPFNFPGHMPNGHFVPALLTGNAVIFKPSEDTPAVGQFITELFDQAGVPRGVFSLVQGGATTGRMLCESRDVDGILFTGSYETGESIKKNTLGSPGKMLALEMGGKNPTIVANDANIDNAVYETLISCFLTTGQRCSSTSRVILFKKISRNFTKRFVSLTKRLSIGYYDSDPFMGPLINEAAVEKYARYNTRATEENNEVVLEGGLVHEDIAKCGYFVKPEVYLIREPNKNSPYQTEEIFAPTIAMYVVEDVDEALEVVNLSKYGLVASVFSGDRRTYEKILRDTRYGLVNWNKGTVGASSRLPFGGQGRSGNYRPTALFSPYYCTYPVSSLEAKNHFDRENIIGSLKTVWYDEEEGQHD